MTRRPVVLLVRAMNDFAIWIVLSTTARNDRDT
jgi:hypothetical protein